MALSLDQSQLLPHLKIFTEENMFGGLLLFVLLNSLTTINKKEKSQKAPLESDLHFNET